MIRERNPLDGSAICPCLFLNQIALRVVPQSMIDIGPPLALAFGYESFPVLDLVQWCVGSRRSAAITAECDRGFGR